MRIRLSTKSDVRFVTLENDVGFSVTFSSLGAGLYSIIYKNHEMLSVPANIEDFKKCYHGKTIGRIANRVRGNKIKINDVVYTLENNEGKNTLHGGPHGLHTKTFKYDLVTKKDSLSVIFKHTVKDLEDGLPGNLNLEVIYTIFKDKFVIEMEYKAVSDKPSVLSLTNHAYFNMGINNSEDLFLKVNASKYLDTENDTLLAIEKKDVNLALNFKDFKKIGKNINNEFLLKSKANGYDHFFYFDEVDISKPNIILVSKHAKLNLYTDFEGAQIYSNNYPSYELRGTDRRVHACVALEPSMSHLELHPLAKNEEYHHKVIYEFMDA